MNTNGQTLWDNPSASAASLGGVGRIDGNHMRTSFFRFVLKHLPEQSKPRIVGGQVSVAVHKGEGEVFNRDQVVVANQLATDFVKIIGSLVIHPLVQSGDTHIGYLLAVTAFDLPGSKTLKAAQFREAFPQPVGIVNPFPGREGGQAFQSNIYADLLPAWDPLLACIRQFQHQADIPTEVDQLDDDVFDGRLVWNGPVVTHSHFAGVLDIEAHLPVFILAQPAAIPVGEFQALETAASLEARKTCRLTCGYSPKECLIGLVETAKQVLQTRSVQFADCFRVLSAQISKVFPLRCLANPLTCFPISRYPLFKSSIVDQPGLPQQEVKTSSLLSVWAKKVFVRAQHIHTRLLHFDVALHGFFGDMTNRPNVAASTPQTRQTGTQVRVFLAQHPGSKTLELICKTLRGIGRVAFDKQVNVVGHDLKGINLYPQIFRFLIQLETQLVCNFTNQQLEPIPPVTHRTIVLFYSIFVEYLSKGTAKPLSHSPAA